MIQSYQQPHSIIKVGAFFSNHSTVFELLTCINRNNHNFIWNVASHVTLVFALAWEHASATILRQSCAEHTISTFYTSYWLRLLYSQASDSAVACWLILDVLDFFLGFEIHKNVVDCWNLKIQLIQHLLHIDLNKLLLCHQLLYIGRDIFSPQQVLLNGIFVITFF